MNLVRFCKFTLCVCNFFRDFCVCPKKKDEALILVKQNNRNELKFFKITDNAFPFNSLNNIYSLSMIDSEGSKKNFIPVRYASLCFCTIVKKPIVTV
jgi:hypothetical protein